MATCFFYAQCKMGLCCLRQVIKIPLRVADFVMNNNPAYSVPKMRLSDHRGSSGATFIGSLFIHSVPSHAGDSTRYLKLISADVDSDRLEGHSLLTLLEHLPTTWQQWIRRAMPLCLGIGTIGLELLKNVDSKSKANKVKIIDVISPVSRSHQLC